MSTTETDKPSSSPPACAAVLGRDGVALAPGMYGDFFSIDLHPIDYAGGLADLVAATLFCQPQKARTTVINGSVVVKDGFVAAVDMAPVIEAHDKFSLEIANG